MSAHRVVRLAVLAALLLFSRVDASHAGHNAPAAPEMSGGPANRTSPSPVALGNDTTLGAETPLPTDAVRLEDVPSPPEAGEAEAMLVQGGPTPRLRYYALDALGSVRVTFDAAGTVIGRADYEPFGAAVTASTTGAQPRQQFTAQERDSEVGVDYFGARMYAPQLGRMSSVDPSYTGAISNPQRWNRYGHVLNNPLALTDPSGRDPFRTETIGNCGGTCFPDVTSFELDWINSWASLTGGDYTFRGVEAIPSWLREVRQGPTSGDYAEAYDPKQSQFPMWEPEPDEGLESMDGDLFDAVSLGIGTIVRGSLSRLMGRALVRAGQVGEAAVARKLVELGEEIGKREAYIVAGRSRISDFSTSTVIREVKNLSEGKTMYFTR